MNKLLKKFIYTSLLHPHSPHQTKAFDTGNSEAVKSSQHDLQTLQNQEYKIRHITLAWLPFKEKGLSLIDPISGLGFPRNLLK